MRKLKVHHEALPGIGEPFQLPAGEGRVVAVVSQCSGRRDLSIATPGGDEPEAIVSLSRAEATALAAPLVGAHIELITDPQP